MKDYLKEIIEAANDKGWAIDYTHRLYRYPASMSPMLARKIISMFTSKNDIVLDPFCGGGTTAIEAIAQGRKVICTDVNSLACFITKTKSTPLKDNIIDKVKNWVELTLEKIINANNSEVPKNFKLNDNLHCKKTVWLLNELQYNVNSRLDSQIQDICKLIILNVGKKCYDCRDAALNPSQLIKIFYQISKLTVKSLYEYSKTCYNISPSFDKERDIKVFCDNAINLPKLIKNDQKNRIKLREFTQNF